MQTRRRHISMELGCSVGSGAWGCKLTALAWVICLPFGKKGTTRFIPVQGLAGQSVEGNTKISLVLRFSPVVTFLDKDLCLACIHVLSLAAALDGLSLQVLPRPSFVTTQLLNWFFLTFPVVETAATLAYSQINIFTSPPTQPTSQQMQN